MAHRLLSGWWERSRAFWVMTAEERRAITKCRATAAHFVRIAKMHVAIGDRLDELRAPLRIYTFIAYAPDRLHRPRIVGQDDRFKACMRFFEERKRWPNPLEIRAIRTELAPMAKPFAVPPTASQPALTIAPAALARSLSIAVARQDPELSAMLQRVAEERERRATEQQQPSSPLPSSGSAPAAPT